MPTSALIAAMLDHSMLQPYLTDCDIARGCDIALEYRTASVCARPADMPTVAKRLDGSGIPACTVIGFPHGSVQPEVKLFEARRALDDGARELDMVINIGRMRAGDGEYVRDEVDSICRAAHEAGALVKVILENCYLTSEEIERACAICSECGADFVKTSTGYGRYGAKLRDLALMRRAAAPEVRIKAAGGIRTLDMVLLCRYAGCARCGTSSTVDIMREALRREAEGALIDKTQSEFDSALEAETY